MLTAKAQEAEKVMGLELGADDYVTKPFSPRELRARIKALLRRAAGERPEVYRFGESKSISTRYEVRRGGERSEVTPIEFKLLAAFLRHPGRVLTRDQLIDEVWGQRSLRHRPRGGQPHRQPAQEDRTGAVAAALPVQRAGDRLPVRWLKL